MKKQWVFFTSLVVLALVVAIVAFSANTTDTPENNPRVTATPIVTSVSAGENNPRATATPTPTPTPKATEKVRWTEKDGKTYFADVRVALDLSVQDRIDAAIMDEYNVYDVVCDGDVVLFKSTYGVISVPQKVRLLCDGNYLLVWGAKEGTYGYGKFSSAASDIGFVKQFYCATHEAFQKEGTVTRFYLSAEPKDLKGQFDTGDFIVSWVLVERNDVYTWCLNLCDCSKDNGQGGGSPSGGSSQTPSGGSKPTATPKPTGENNVMGENNSRPTPRPSSSTSSTATSSTTVGESSERPTADWHDTPVQEDTEF